MIKKLERIKPKIYHYVDDVRVEGPPSDVSGDLTGVSGNLDDCEITDTDRARGIDIADLIETGETK
jgi:hypothetical protein